MSCAFILTKSLDLPLYFPFFTIYIIMLLYIVDHEESSFVEDSIQEMLEDLLQA
jgi:hypothetical protein